EYPEIARRLADSGAKPNLQPVELRRRIGPIANDIIKLSYRRILDTCRARGIPVVAIVFPTPQKSSFDDLPALTKLAAAAGLPLITLEGVYDGYSVPSITLQSGNNRADPHLNGLGHKLVADRLYTLLRADDAKLLKIGFAGLH
ncbi:MAG TPA: hypothetical protein VHM24_14555, partial [Gemmatimonadaceae bacterium]|nr:hypothetical protein [Gemmatimonadaceae bacterium]